MSEPEGEVLHEWIDDSFHHWQLRQTAEGYLLIRRPDEADITASQGQDNFAFPWPAWVEFVNLAATVKALREERDRSIQVLESVALLSRVAQIHKSRGGVEDWKHAERIAIEGGAKPSSPLRAASVPAVSAEEE